MATLLESGVSPIFAPVSNPDFVDLLTDAGGDPGRPMESGDTPLEVAAGLGHTAVVKRLLSHGAPRTDRAVEMAAHRGFRGVQLALAIGDGEDLGRSLGAGDILEAPVRVLRLLAPTELLTVSHGSVLVRWVRDSETSEFLPRDWRDVDQNQITWIEASGVASDGVLLACGDAGLTRVEIDSSEISVAPSRPDPQPSAVQVVVSAGGRIHVVADRHAHNPEFQAAWVDEQLLVLHEGPQHGDDPTLALSLRDGELDHTAWAWSGAESGAVRPAAMAVSAQDVCVQYVTGSGELRATVVGIGGSEVATASFGLSPRPLPALQSVASLEDGFAVIADGRVTTVLRDATIAGQEDFDEPVIAVEARYGVRLVGTTRGLYHFQTEQ